ncbi:PqiC family protein [Prosthecobacter debontii]|uniref:PqiC family protein n=1 Tax=Prosthecobacter debontii TaxID=48467 RepID=UPI001592A5E1|nr:PqiC family protein [Prosthecobacter debontii]
MLDPAIPFKAGSSSTPALAVARPSLPSYLDRQQLVSRDATGSVKVMDSQLWLEPLTEGIARVTAANLSRLTGSTTILPVSDFLTLDYTGLVELRVLRFDPDATGAMILECTWRIQTVRGTELPYQSFRTEVPLPPGASAADHVKAMNDALGQLARKIATRA